MKNTYMSYNVDYNDVLRDLKAKRDMLDITIQNIEKLAANGLANSAPFSQSTEAPCQLFSLGEAPSNIPHGPFANKGVYESAIELLKTNGRPMRTAEIVQALQKGGKQLVSKNPSTSIAVTLYKHAKKEEELRNLGEGNWGLTNW